MAEHPPAPSKPAQNGHGQSGTTRSEHAQSRPANTPPANEARRPGMDQTHHAVPRADGGPALRLARRRAHRADRHAGAGLLGAQPAQGCQPRPAHRFAAGKLLSRLADLEPARIRRPRRHLSRAGRAGPVRPDAQCGARCRRGHALSGADGRADPPQRLLHGARHLRDAPHHQPHERGGGARAHRRKPRRRARRDRRSAARLVRPGFLPSPRARPALLAEAGFTYTTDWASDDRPFLLGPYHLHSLVALAAAAGMERSRMHVAAPRHAAGLGRRHRRGVCRPARRRRRGVQPDAASLDHRPGAPHPLAARGTDPRARPPGIWRTTTDEVAAQAREQL